MAIATSTRWRDGDWFSALRGLLAGRGNSAQTEALDGGRAGVRTHLQRTEHLTSQRSLVAEAKDEDAGSDLPGGEQTEPTGLLPQLHLRIRRCIGRSIGQDVRKLRVACLVERGKPRIEEVAGRAVGDQAHVIAKARQVNDDKRVHGADVVSPAGGHRSVGRIPEHDGVDLRWIVFVIGRRRGCGSGRNDGRTCRAAIAEAEMRARGVAQQIEDQGERTGCGYEGKQYGFGAEPLASGDVKVGNRESGNPGRESLLHRVFLRCSAAGRAEAASQDGQPLLV